MEPSESDLIAAYSDLRMIFICNISIIKNLKDLIWIMLEKFGSLSAVDFYCLSGFLSTNGGLTWTDKALQLKQAQTRVIDMNAVPEEISNIMKY